MFVALYAVVNLFYLQNFGAWGWDYAALFLTSPFNPIEIVASAYGSYMVGEVLNFGVVSIIILGADVYYRFLAIRFRSGVGPTVILLIAISASYLLSGLTWAITKTPSTGTSVVGFVMGSMIVISSSSDFRNYWRKRLILQGRPAPSIPKMIVYIVFLVLSWTTVIALFLVGNNQYWLHLLGGGIGLALFGAYLASKRLWHQQVGPSQS